MPFLGAQSAIADRHLRQREAGAHDVGRGLGDARRGRGHHHQRRLRLRGDRRRGQRRRRDAEAGQHVDLVVDDQFLREAARHVGQAGVVLEDQLRPCGRRRCRRSAPSTACTAASIWRPVVACWPVIGRIRPIRNPAPAWARAPSGGPQRGATAPSRCRTARRPAVESSRRRVCLHRHQWRTIVAEKTRAGRERGLEGAHAKASSSTPDPATRRCQLRHGAVRSPARSARA